MSVPSMTRSGKLLGRVKEAIDAKDIKKRFLDVPIPKPSRKKPLKGRPKYYHTRLRRGKRVVPGVKAEPWKEAVLFVNRERTAEGLLPIDHSRDKEQERKKSQDPCLTMSYYDTITFSRHVISEQWATRVAKELVQWVEANPDAIKINEFLRLKGIYYRDFYYFVGKYEILEKALNYAKRALGDYRERNVLERKWDSSCGQYMMGHYSDEWREETERRDKVKSEQNQTTNVDLTDILKVVMKPQAPTEEVRLRKEVFNAGCSTETTQLPNSESDIPSED
jgi:hypothetical protein